MIEYLAIAVAFHGQDVRIVAPAKIFLASSAAEAEAQALPWLAEELPPAQGWEGHTLRVERLDALRPAHAAGLSA